MAVRPKLVVTNRKSSSGVEGVADSAQPQPGFVEGTSSPSSSGASLGPTQRRSLKLVVHPSVTPGSHKPKPIAGSITTGRISGSSGASTADPALRPLTHDQRVRLIRQPFLSQRIPAKSWGGVNVGNAGAVPETGHRTWQLSATDESYLRYGKSDDDTQGD